MKLYTLRLLLTFQEEGGSFGSCSAWEGANDSHGGKVCLRELRLGGNYANKL